MARVSIDGNEACARAAYALSEAVAIYPITPASPMGEHADAWSAAGRTNVFGTVPRVVEMQSEGGAAGALHGMATEGVLATTFTASQGLLLMLPNIYKLAGELTPAVVHVAARTVATHALSIFGDHSDVMAARQTGAAILVSGTPQEAHDLAAVAHVASLASRLPFLHAFDGFRTSHELNSVELLDEADLRALLSDDDLAAHRRRGLTPDAPVLRGSAQNPDVFFQAREAANPYTDAAPAIVADAMAALGARTGRHHEVVERVGHPDPDRLLVVMGSVAGVARETVEELVARGERVGLVVVRLYRPFPTEALLAAIPDGVRAIAVLDRTKEPGAPGEPLYLDVVAALTGAVRDGGRALLPRVLGGRYGLSSKECTPAMLAGVFAALDDPSTRHGFTVGIVDDVTFRSIDPDPTFALPPKVGDLQAVVLGLGSDGTVGATKETVKILGEHAGLHAQGYFVYDSKKAGAQTVSHLRVSADPIRSTYLVESGRADVVAVHQFAFVHDRDVLHWARPGAQVLLNAPFPADQVWDTLPRSFQRTVLDRDLHLHVIDAARIARDLGLGGRINTVMQPAFLRLSGLLPDDVATAALRASVQRTYAKRGPDVVARNLEAIEAAAGALAEVPVPAEVTATHEVNSPLERALALGAGGGSAPSFVERVTGRIMAGEGDLLPVSALPVDGTFPTGTSRYERRSLATELPTWDPDICVDCGRCAIVCPHDAIQIKVFEPASLDDAPDTFLAKEFRDRDLTGHLLTVQVAPDDCTGCGVCATACPALDRSAVGHKALEMSPVAEVRDLERERWGHFESIPRPDRTAVRHDTVKHSQLLEPLFGASGACAGCGETPYLKLVTQLFGDRMVVANATGCSSIYGGNLPTTPWGTDAAGRGPAWSNSLFEDNGEFGLGIRVGLDQRRAEAVALLDALASHLDPELVAALVATERGDESVIVAQRERVDRLRAVLADVPADAATAALVRRLDAVAGDLVPRDVWIVGGDGWAYDIGFGGLDHVLASGADVNVLVLDTEVYSNTGGQASKATPRAAVARFATGGKATPKKDLGLLAAQYGHVYVAQVALGADPQQTLKALREAQAWPGPSLVLAYSPCVAHGIDLRQGPDHQRLAVETGYWPLYRHHPDAGDEAQPLRLDSRAPSRPLSELLQREGRYAVLARSDPERAAHLAGLAQADVDERWRYLRQLAGVVRTDTDAEVATDRVLSGVRRDIDLTSTEHEETPA